MNTPTVTVAGALKVSAAIATIGAAAYFLPILEVMKTFFWVVAVPLAVLASVGIITSAAFNTAVNFIPQVIEDLEKRIDEHQAQTKEAA